MSKSYACSYCGATYVRTRGMRGKCSLACLLWSKVDRNGPIPAHRPELGPCHVWTGHTVGGYGRMGVGRRRLGVHRVAWTLMVGPIPEGEGVLHHCDNTLCVRREHLFTGTQVDNIADMVAKGRQATAHGSGHGMAKLTEADVVVIRARRAAGETMRRIADDYGVSDTTVSWIASRRIWRHVA